MFIIPENLVALKNGGRISPAVAAIGNVIGIKPIINLIDGELKKENYDACDSLICALAYININHYGIEKPTITEYKKEDTNDEVIITYTTKIWNRTYNKTLRLSK